MYWKTLLLAASITTCLANLDTPQQDKEISELNRLGRTSITGEEREDVAVMPSFTHQGIHSVSTANTYGSSPYSSRSFSVVDESMEKLCKNKENEFLCSDCKTLVICVDGNPYAETCEYGSVCSTKTSFKGGVCFPGDPAECTCNKADIFKRDYYNPSKFLSCSGIEGTDPIIHSCPKGLVFNEQRRTCGTDIESTCTVSGTFAVKEDCSRYYTCIFSTRGWVQKEFTCRNNTMFNEDTGNCEDPCDWYTGHFTCEAEGRYENPSDCNKYYECSADPKNSNRFNWVERECPNGYEWSQMVNGGIGHCVVSGTGSDKCVPLKANKCKIPNEWCTAESLSCHSQITRGRSYFINPNFTESDTSINPCIVDILPNEDTYQIRLDFEVFNIAPPLEGECSNDTFIVTGANSGSEIPVICGENGGQHMYIDIDSTDDPIKLTVSTSGLYVDRSWKILVSFIDVNDPNKAPNNCLQYHKGTSGQLMSFNYGTGAQPIMLNNLSYGICFAYVPEFCDIGLNFDRFDIGNIDGDCAVDYLGVNYDRYCGDYDAMNLLANITAGPISLFVSTNENNENLHEGFSGSYAMLGC